MKMEAALENADLVFKLGDKVYDPDDFCDTMRERKGRPRALPAASLCRRTPRAGDLAPCALTGRRSADKI